MSAGDEPQAAGCAPGAARSGAANLREGEVSETLLRLAGPMLVGIASAFFFGLVDAFWTSLLGAHELAAMGFIMPVVFCVLSVVIGIGIGTTGVVARATGRADREAIERFATHGAALAAVITVVLAALGLSTLEPLFTSLGASPALRATIAEYMVPWYAGAGFLVVQMTGNAALRGTGDTKTPMMLMLVSGLVNMALDPVLIFGVGPIPGFGFAGAAYATVASWSCASLLALHLLVRRFGLWVPHRLADGRMLSSWVEILQVGLPAAATQLLAPASGAVLTRMVANHGDQAVAAFGLAGRFEPLAIVGTTALAAASTAFSGQNVAAGAYGRMREAIAFCARATWVWCGAVALLLAACGGGLIRLFADDAATDIARIGHLYFLIVPFSYVGLGFATIVGSAFNGANLPTRAARIVVFRLFVIGVPAAYLGDRWFGLVGLFGGIAAGNLATGALALWLVRGWLDGATPSAARPDAAHATNVMG